MMSEIRCPKCGEIFQVDEVGYDQIARQVRDAEFEKELKRREREMEQKRENELQLMRLQEEKEYAESLTQKESEITEKDRMIAELKAKLQAGETEKQLAVAEAEKKNKQ